jgi:hypothetical protein
MATELATIVNTSNMVFALLLQRGHTNHAAYETDEIEQITDLAKAQCN